MKKIILTIILAVMLMASNAFATWTLTPSIVSQAGHILLWKVICTSDGSSLAATDLVAQMPADLKQKVQKSLMMVMKVSPGLVGVAPDTTIDVTLSDEQGTAIFVHTGYSNVADTTGINLAEDYNQYLPVFGLFYITINDIGTAGDQVTLYFECWLEDK